MSSYRRAKSAGRGKKPARAAGANTRPARAAHAGTAPSRARAAAAHGGSKSAQGGVLEGVVSANRGGFGFVKVEGLEEGVYLPAMEMTGVMHGDRVRIELRRDARQRSSGHVLAILTRGLQSYLGTVERAGRDWFVRAADRRLNLRCRLKVQSGEAPLAEGEWIIARVTRYPSATQDAEAEVHRRLDPERPVQMACETAIARAGLPEEFPVAALADAERWGTTVDAREAASRTDLRPLPLVTIDGETARDFDDAVYAERADDGFRLIVAIADVSHYVRPGTALDAEARRRGTSVYFPTRVLPMLPPALSDELCSLKPQVDRLCMVADMRIDKRGILRDTRCYPAVMRSAARLTYTQAHAALFERKREARDALGTFGAAREPLVGRLEPLVELYGALLKARHKRGALDFDAPEADFDIDAGEHIRGIRFDRRNDAHKLIEECMVLANVAVARELGRARVPALYRVHASPEERKLTQLRQTLRVLGIEIQLPEEVRTADLAQIAPRVRDAGTRAFVETLVVRSLAQALYQPDNIGHFGLALGDYAHFTSPIRRYPDLMIHRALRVMLGIAPRSTIEEHDELELAGIELSRLEKRADESDRYVGNFLKCVYLRDRLGQSFDGLVTTVTEFGCFVQIVAVGVDGLLHVNALRDDDYQMSRDGTQWIGKRTGRRLAPGTRLRVDVIAARPVEGMIDLELADEQPVPARKGGG